jgi:tRNA threonylcarbamoyladenosine dehydratase
MIPLHAPMAADLERRFGGLRRLYGDAGYARLRTARVAVVGVGGVGSWAAEALARSGVAALALIDMDHVAESNINRQVQALGATLGMAKVQALALRIADINPRCVVQGVEAFADGDNWPAMLPGPVDAVIDACDQMQAKLALAAWARKQKTAFVCVGAAGGKQLPQRVEVDDLANATHDPLLAALRQRLRRQGEGQGEGAPRQGAIGVRCVFSRESVRLPDDAACAADIEGNLNCHGYGSSVVVTATFGLAAASDVLQQLLVRTREPTSAGLPL